MYLKKHSPFCLRRTSFARPSGLFILLCALTVFGCSAGDGKDKDDAPSDGTVTSITRTVRTEADGSAQITFEVPGGTTKFSVTADAGGNAIRFDSLTDDNNNNFLSPGGEFISFGTEFLGFVNNITVPSRDFDPGVNPSRTFRARASAGRGSFNTPVQGVDMRFQIDSRADGDLNSGTLRINLFFAGSVGQAATSRAAVAAALEEFRRIFRNSAGIALVVNESSVSASNTLPSPFSGSSFYQSASSSVTSPAVNVFIAGDVDSGFGAEVLGIAGGIPGPANASPRSAVVVSMLTSAGPDGSFDDEEIRVLGETMAHESGHFMGLFHPVDFSGSSVSGVDPLPDTATCSNLNDCNSPRRGLINNLMYPSPVADGSGDLVPQNVLSPQQRGVLNRYIAVD